MAVDLSVVAPTQPSFRELYGAQKSQNAPAVLITQEATLIPDDIASACRDDNIAFCKDMFRLEATQLQFVWHLIAQIWQNDSPPNPLLLDLSPTHPVRLAVQLIVTMTSRSLALLADKSTVIPDFTGQLVGIFCRNPAWARCFMAAINADFYWVDCWVLRMLPAESRKSAVALVGTAISGIMQIERCVYQHTLDLLTVDVGTKRAIDEISPQLPLPMEFSHELTENSPITQIEDRTHSELNQMDRGVTTSVHSVKKRKTTRGSVAVETVQANFPEAPSGLHSEIVRFLKNFGSRLAIARPPAASICLELLWNISQNGRDERDLMVQLGYVPSLMQLYMIKRGERGQKHWLLLHRLIYLFLRDAAPAVSTKFYAALIDETDSKDEAESKEAEERIAPSVCTLLSSFQATKDEVLSKSTLEFIEQMLIDNIDPIVSAQLLCHVMHECKERSAAIVYVLAEGGGGAGGSFFHFEFLNVH
jgi:hypothetical protein